MAILLRFIVMFAITWFAWQAFRRWVTGVQTRARASSAQTQQPLVGGKIVKCCYCELHLPEREALRQHDKWFCCAEHAKSYRARQ
jgi:uncharacterized protein